MSVLDAIGLILLSAVACIVLYVVAMILGSMAEWLVLKARDHAAHRQ